MWDWCNSHGFGCFGYEVVIAGVLLLCLFGGFAFYCDYCDGKQKKESKK